MRYRVLAGLAWSAHREGQAPQFDNLHRSGEGGCINARAEAERSGSPCPPTQNTKHTVKTGNRDNKVVSLSGGARKKQKQR